MEESVLQKTQDNCEQKYSMIEIRYIYIYIYGEKSSRIYDKKIVRARDVV